MKKSDVVIISQLRNNGRMSLTEMSKRTGLPVSTIHERLKRGMERGLLRPTALLGFERLGFATRAYILLSIERDKERVLDFLRGSPNVNSLFRINNGWNVLADCVFKDMPALENFVDLLESRFRVRERQVHYVLDVLKLERFFSDLKSAESLVNVKQTLNSSKRA